MARAGNDPIFPQGDIGMVRTSMRAMLAALALCVASLLAASQAEAAHPDLFYNFYNGPTPCGPGLPAQLYISPRPTPPLVGHTFITYQPLLPHEFMYHHHRKYYKYHHLGGHTTACVKYYSSPTVAFFGCLLR
jgi:hypothetical protein